MLEVFGARADLGVTWSASAPPFQNFYYLLGRRLIEAIVQVQVHTWVMKRWKEQEEKS